MLTIFIFRLVRTAAIPPYRIRRFVMEVFDVGVDFFGVANWVRTLESVPPWWESFREALYAEMGLARGAALAEHDALHAVVTQHAAPQRVVEIEHETLLRHAALSAHDPRHIVAVERRDLRGDFLLRLEHARGIEPLVEAVATTRARNIE